MLRGHFAAQTHVDNSFGNSFTFTENNVLGTHILLEAAKAHDVRRFIHVSTDEVYGEGAEGEGEMTEEHILGPTNPYASTKAAAEFLVKAYFHSFKLPMIITRGNNVFGPHQFPEKLIPKFFHQLTRGKPVTLHGDGLNTRNYLYVEDVARAFDVILHSGCVGQVYNIGDTNEVSNIDVARALVREMYGEGADADPLMEFVPDRCFNDRRYTIDTSKLKALGWEEEVSWEDGVRATMRWYEAHKRNWPEQVLEAALVAHPRMLGS